MRTLQRERTPLLRADRYLEEEQPLKFLSPALEEQLGDRHSEIVMGIPRFATEAYDHRLDIRGFQVGDENADAGLGKAMTDWFEFNEGEFQSQQAHFEGLGLGRAYAIVGPNDDDPDMPILTVESPFDCIHELDGASRQVLYGLKEWTDEDRIRWTTLYTEEGRTTWRRVKSSWVEDSSTEYGFGLCSLQPIIPTARYLGRVSRRTKHDQRLGRPVFQSIVSLVDALNKIAYDMMISAEFHALPRRWATGLTENDFIDQATGKQLDVYSMIAGRIWGSENEKAKFGQFQEADLQNFHNTIKLLIQVASTLLGLPADYLAFTGDNPTSADAIRASETQLVKRAERMQTALSPAWARVQRLRALHAGEADSRELRQIEVNWRSASTPTKSQEADATTKLVTTTDKQGRSVVPIEQARIDLGYSAAQRRAMAKMDREAIDPYRAAEDDDEEPDDVDAAGGA